MKEDTLPKIINLLKKLEDLTSGCLTNERYALESANTLWELSPFSVGDRVKLNTTPEITEKKSWGWLHARHFLIEGSLATVHHREFYDGQFVFGLHFDNDSYMDRYGVKHPSKEKGLYMFRGGCLSKA